MNEFFQKIIKKVKELDFFVNEYKTIAKDIGLPSFAYNNWALHLAEEGKEDLALEKLQTSDAMAFNNPYTQVNLGIYRARKKDFKEAEKCFKRAIKTDRNCAKAYALLGSVYCEEGDDKASKRMFEAAIKIESKNAQHYTSYAIALSKMKEYDKAKENFLKAYLYNCTNAQIPYLWGILLAETKEYTEAVEKFKIAYALSPFHADALYYMAFCYSNLQDWDNAINYSKKALGVKPEKIETHLLLAESYMHKRAEKECFEVYKEALDNPKANAANSFNFYQSWGVALQAFGYWENSIEKFEKASEIDENNFISYHCLSLSYLKMGKMEECEQMLLKTIELNPDYVPAVFNLGQLNSQRENYKEAVKYFKHVVEIDKEAHYVFFEIARCYHLQKDYKNAIKYYEKLLEYDKENLEAQVNLANIYSICNDNQLAIRKIRNAYIKNKNNADINLLYGMLLLKDGKFSDAIEKFEQAFCLNENLILAQFGKCECLVKLNKPKEALGILQNYEDTNPEDKDFLVAKLIAYVKLNELEESEYYKKTSIDICDKIISIYGKDEWVSEILDKLGDKKQ